MLKRTSLKPSARRIETIGAPMPRLSAVAAAEGFAVTVVWAEGARAGVTETVDLAPQIMRYRLYAPLPARGRGPYLHTDRLERHALNMQRRGALFPLI